MLLADRVTPGTTTYGYANGLLASENGPWAEDTVGYWSNTGSQRTRQTRLAGDYVDYTYDAAGQLKTALGKESGGVTNRLAERFGYVYDAGGNLQYRTNNALVQSFGVNNVNQLTTVGRTGTLTVAGGTTMPATNVTVNGQRATVYADQTFVRTDLSLTSGPDTFTAVAQDSYGRADTNAVTVTLPASVTYTYDDNGNLVSDGQMMFEYDGENQLVAVQVAGSWRSEFRYDGKLRRRVRVEKVWQNSHWVTASETRYVYDPASAGLVVQERDGNNLPVVSYTRGRDLSGTREGAGGIGGLLARTDNRLLITSDPTAHACYHADGNGNITALANSTQGIVARYLYDPYGNLLAKAGSLADANLYRFSSKELHASSCLYYYGYRFYAPNLQRWLNRDPILERGGLNLYSFAEQEPTDKVDTDGQGVFSRILPGIMRGPWTCLAIAAANYRQNLEQAQDDLDSCLERCNSPCHATNEECVNGCMLLFHIEVSLAAAEYVEHSLKCMLPPIPGRFRRPF